MKRMLLCADDFAQSPAISAGIVELVEARRLGAVSCMTNSPYWPEMSTRLKTIGGTHQTGLHFNLTHRFDERIHRPLLHLMAQAMGHHLNEDEIEKEFLTQWHLFEKHYGKPPDFVDGHQHVHAFPQIRHIVIRETAKRNPSAWLRWPHSRSFSPKALVLRFLTYRFLENVESAGLECNTRFAGFRPYHAEFDFPHFFRKTVRKAPSHTLIMCHPGRPECDPLDPIATSRAAELHYLLSMRFIEDMTDAQIELL